MIFHNSLGGDLVEIRVKSSLVQVLLRRSCGNPLKSSRGPLLAQFPVGKPCVPELGLPPEITLW